MRLAGKIAFVLGMLYFALFFLGGCGQAPEQQINVYGPQNILPIESLPIVLPDWQFETPAIVHIKFYNAGKSGYYEGYILCEGEKLSLTNKAVPEGEIAIISFDVPKVEKRTNCSLHLQKGEDIITWKQVKGKPYDSPTLRLIPGKE